jgi:hypothetical protein
MREGARHPMQLEAIYDDGKLEFCRPVRFTHGRLLVRVEVPEQGLVEPMIKGGKEPLSAYASDWLCRVESIRTEVLTTPEAELLPITDEQLERLHAIKMRVES